MEKKLSLYELNSQVKDLLKSSFTDQLWVIAEINELSVNSRGHCYLELVEKNPENNTIIARTRSTIWASTFRLLKPYFETTAGRPLSIGIKVLIQVQVEFHELYGFSLNIKDIEPSYTLGDIARQRMETINKLKAEGIFDMNRELHFPLLPFRIALISSKTAAGYEDFINQLQDHPSQYGFKVSLFQSNLQGTQAVPTIIHALDIIYEQEEKFDVVVIVRGGGSQSDLNIFNDYTLCSHLAQFPIPVLTGIGHDRDEAIADMVSYARLKTPTAVAEYLISKVNEQELYLKQVSGHILGQIQTKLFEETRKISNLSADLKHTVTNLVHENISELGHIISHFRNSTLVYRHKQQQNIKSLQGTLKTVVLAQIGHKKYQLLSTRNNLKHISKQSVQTYNQKLRLYEKTIKLLDPTGILKRGYSITIQKGKVVKNASDLDPKTPIQTTYATGSSESTLTKINPENKKLS